MKDIYTKEEVIGLLEQQKQIVIRRTIAFIEMIEQAPYPVESDLVVLDKLMLKTIIDNVYNYGLHGLTPKEGEEKLIKDFNFDIKKLTL
jgi:hypothetical protein